MEVTDIRISFGYDNKPELTLTLNEGRDKAVTDYEELKRILADGKKLTAEIKQLRKKRSLDSNSYSWVLMSRLADVLRCSKEEVYITMLTRYGQREDKVVPVIEEAVETLRRATQGHIAVIGTRHGNGAVFKDIAFLIGSSNYDTQQMAVFLDGIISECKEVGIETATPSEVALMNQAWKGGS